jgi:hypothetical protein
VGGWRSTTHGFVGGAVARFSWRPDRASQNRRARIPRIETPDFGRISVRVSGTMHGTMHGISLKESWTSPKSQRLIGPSPSLNRTTIPAIVPSTEVRVQGSPASGTHLQCAVQCGVCICSSKHRCIVQSFKRPLTYRYYKQQATLRLRIKQHLEDEGPIYLQDIFKTLAQRIVETMSPANTSTSDVTVLS